MKTNHWASRQAVRYPPVAGLQRGLFDNVETPVHREEERTSDGQTLDLRHITFDPRSRELQTTWSSFAKTILCVNAYPNGVSVSVHSNDPDARAAAQKPDGASENTDRYLSNSFHLRFKDTRDYQLPLGRYFLFKENYAESLERQLSQLHKQGLLSSAVCYFGVTADPFFIFHKRFDVTMKCLELLEQYQPGFLVVQTRSPLVVSALPTLKFFGSRGVVAMPLETPLEQAVNRYTPGQPAISDRLLAVDGLRKQGVRVNLVASPALPYGDFYRDAWKFAEMLSEHADFITFGALAGGAPSDEAQLKTLPLARRLAADKQFRWLRPYSFRYLYYAVQSLAPEKLTVPAPLFPKTSQLSLFAA